MKTLFLFCTRLRAYWTLIPVTALLILAIKYNPMVEEAPKLIPLIILCILAIIFIFIYFFRGIVISYQEIRYVGRFSSRDSAEIKEGKTLILSRGKGSRVNLLLFGLDELPRFDWMKESEENQREAVSFRGRIYSGRWGIKRILRFFGVDASDLPSILNDTGFNKTYENVSVSTKLNSDEKKEIHIRINVTI